MVESGFGQQAGDIYSSLGGGGNMLSVNQAASGLLPAIGPGIAFAGPLDDIDSFDRNSPALIGSGGFPGVPILFSLDPASPFLASFGYTAGDILIAVPGFGRQLFLLAWISLR